MDIRRLAPALSVSEQIFPSQLAELKAAGFRAIICNRPDGEGSDQPLFAEIKRAADAVESLITVGLERTQSAFNS